MPRLIVLDLKRTVALFCLTLLASRGAPQEGAAGIGASLLEDAKVREVLEAVRVNEPQVLEDQVRLCEIEAPSFHEQARAAVMKAEFENAGLQNIRIDAVGNVLGERPGRQARPRVVVASHLDTVFPSGTDLRVRREGALLKGPGIGDNCRGLATLLGMVRALQKSKIETTGPITFVANVGEEALGNLRGALQQIRGVERSRRPARDGPARGDQMDPRFVR